jgi:hypothetical protein
VNEGRIAFRLLFDSNYIRAHETRRHLSLDLDRFRPESAIPCPSYLIVQLFGAQRYFPQSTGVYEDPPVNPFAARHFLVSNVAP